VAAGLILAGGASSRMGRFKALLPVGPAPDAPTFVEALVALLSAVGSTPIGVVTGASPLGLACPAPAIEVVAVDWALGMRASLRAGLRALPFASGVLMTHVDRPRVRPETLHALLSGSPDEARVPTFSGAPGHPVYLPPALCERLCAPDATPLDRVLAEWAAAGGPLRPLSVDDPDVLLNVNTPEALAALHRRPIRRADSPRRPESDGREAAEAPRRAR